MRMWGSWNLHTEGVSAKCSSRVGKCSTVFHKPKNTSTIHLSHSTSSYLLKMKTQTCRWTSTVIFVFIFIAPNWKQPSCSSGGKRSNFSIFIQGTRLHNKKKKKNTKICSNRDEFQSVRVRSRHEGFILYTSIIWNSQKGKTTAIKI